MIERRFAQGKKRNDAMLHFEYGHAFAAQHGHAGLTNAFIFGGHTAGKYDEIVAAFLMFPIDRCDRSKFFFSRSRGGRRCACVVGRLALRRLLILRAKIAKQHFAILVQLDYFSAHDLLHEEILSATVLGSVLAPT